MRNNPILSKINPIITFFVVLAVVLGATFLTLRWVESRKAPAAPIAQAPKASQAPQEEKKEQPAQENKTQSESKQEEQKPAETQQPAAQQPVQVNSTDEQAAPSATSSEAAGASNSSSLPDTGLSLASLLTFIVGTGVTIYLSLTIRRQKLALRP